jgi:hypothetical protein
VAVSNLLNRPDLSQTFFVMSILYLSSASALDLARFAAGPAARIARLPNRNHINRL